jgi:hypothetical protein
VRRSELITDPNDIRRLPCPLTPAKQQLVESFKITLPARVRTRNIPGDVALYTDAGAWFPGGVTELIDQEDSDLKCTA